MVDDGKNAPSLGSIKLVWAAMIVAGFVSAGDALIMRYYYVPMWLLRFVSLVAIPGELGAWFLNSLAGGGHSVTSGTREFVFSLPFNFIAYWMLLTACVEISRMLLPKKR